MIGSLLLMHHNVAFFQQMTAFALHSDSVPARVVVREGHSLPTMSTIEVVAFSGGTAKMGIFTRDHCPPHVTLREQTGQWVVRIAFSFRNDNVALLSIIPPKNRPTAAIINELAQAVQRNLPECRRLWWSYQRGNPLSRAEGPCCLNNQQHAGATIVTASYDPAKRETRIELDDHTVITMIV